MPKAVSLTPEALSIPQNTPAAATPPRAPKKTAAKREKLQPLQIHLLPEDLKAIKIARAQGDFRTVSDFMLACFHAYMKSCKA